MTMHQGVIQDLDDDEEICSVCNGSGLTKKEKEIPGQGICCKCSGKGKVDWVTNIMGIKKIHNGHGNIAIGCSAGQLITNGSKNILIGYNVGHQMGNKPK